MNAKMLSHFFQVKKNIQTEEEIEIEENLNRLQIEGAIARNVTEAIAVLT